MMEIIPWHQCEVLLYLLFYDHGLVALGPESQGSLSKENRQPLPKELNRLRLLVTRLAYVSVDTMMMKKHNFYLRFHGSSSYLNGQSQRKLFQIQINHE